MPSATIPAGVRVYAVGDIHGRAEPLVRLVAMIRADASAHAMERNVLIFLGDYVDRGLESRQVVDFLLRDPAPGFETFFLKGNHDAWLLDFLDNPETGRIWFPAGGAATLLSYGVAAPAAPFDPDALAEARASFEAALPPAHRSFFETLGLYCVEGGYAFVHAGIRPRVPLTEQREEDLLAIRDEFLASRRDHGKVVVHGHSIVDVPDVRPNRVGIDTGAYATGRLTCLVVEGGSRRFIASDEA
ncbi:MAG: serine/threonine protein phosphatase [Pseudomonadales bacterium]|nr:serine/threonine protein phosphatase [Pseudomonadales bacterium]